MAGYRAVKAALSIPIAGGECEFTRFGFRDLLVSRALDIVQPDTCAAGGLSECKKIADMAEAFGLRYNPHVWGTGIAIAASLQLLAVLPSHTPTSLAPLEPMLEFDRTEHPIRQAILTRPIEHAAAWCACPTDRGSGSRWTAMRWRDSRHGEGSLRPSARMHKERDQQDDRQRNADKPEQCAFHNILCRTSFRCSRQHNRLLRCQFLAGRGRAVADPVDGPLEVFPGDVPVVNFVRMIACRSCCGRASVSGELVAHLYDTTTGRRRSAANFLSRVVRQQQRLAALTQSFARYFCRNIRVALSTTSAMRSAEGAGSA